MKLELKCPCGASLLLIDNRESFIHTGGKRDEKGRTMKWEVIKDDWLEEHRNCKDKQHERHT